MHSEFSDQIGQMPRLIWVCAHMQFCWFCLAVAHIIEVSFCWHDIVNVKKPWDTLWWMMKYFFADWLLMILWNLRCEIGKSSIQLPMHFLLLSLNKIMNIYHCISYYRRFSYRHLTGLGSSVGTALLWGGCEFEPRPGHTKVFKNGTSCTSLGALAYKVELGLVNPVSGKCDLVEYHVRCLGHDTSVRQHYKSEHWAPCLNQTSSWYDWKNVESDIKFEAHTYTFLLIKDTSFSRETDKVGIWW